MSINTFSDQPYLSSHSVRPRHLSSQAWLGDMFDFFMAPVRDNGRAGTDEELNEEQALIDRAFSDEVDLRLVLEETASQLETIQSFMEDGQLAFPRDYRPAEKPVEKPGESGLKYGYFFNGNARASRESVICYSGGLGTLIMDGPGLGSNGLMAQCLRPGDDGPDQTGGLAHLAQAALASLDLWPQLDY